ncbi:MAG: universal stress protein [Acidobacteria bacterium]|nr:universal stress protein [Acidobacteriota bacterium]
MNPSESRLLFEIPLARQATTSALDVHVICTNIPGTIQAIEHAAALAKDLHARIRLLVPQVVHYSLPLDSPPVLVEFSESRYRRLAERLDVEVDVEIYLCRDATETLMHRLAEHSLVVLGGRQRWWWPTQESLLARTLRRLGHEVAFVALKRKE